MAGRRPSRCGSLADPGVTSNSSASAPWPKPDHQDLLAGLAFSSAATSSISGCAAPVSPQIGVQGIADRLVVDAGRLGDRVGDARQRRRHAEVRHVLGGRNPAASRQRLITGGTIGM